MTAAEEWLPVVGYEGLYEVSDLGRIRRIKPRSNAAADGILQPYNAGHSGRYYPAVSLGKKTCKVHHLVTAAFIGKRPDGYAVNHKDGDKTNNRFSNLEYVTYTENAIHARDAGLRRVKLDWETVRKIRHRVAETSSTAKIAREFGLSTLLVWKIATNRIWHNDPNHRDHQCISGVGKADGNPRTRS